MQLSWETGKGGGEVKIERKVAVCPICVEEDIAESSLSNGLWFCPSCGGYFSVLTYDAPSLEELLGGKEAKKCKKN